MAVELRAARSLAPAHLAITAHETPGAAVTNARFASLHGLAVAPSPHRRRPFHFANRALVTSEHPQSAAGAAGFRLRLGGGRCAPAAFR